MVTVLLQLDPYLWLNWMIHVESFHNKANFLQLYTNTETKWLPFCRQHFQIILPKPQSDNAQLYPFDISDIDGLVLNNGISNT